MDQATIIVFAVVGSLGVLSAILGFSAEGTKLTVRDLPETIDEFCIYPQSPALGLGVSAAIFMIIAQVIVAAVGGCYGCSKARAIPWESKRIIGVICAVFSWIVAVIAFAMLVYGAAWNANTARYASPYGFCYLLVDGVFAGAVVLTLVATALGLASYVLLWWQPDAASAAATAAKTGVEQPPAGISMGKPQFPQAAPPPSGEADTRVPPPPPTTTQGGDGGQAPNQQQQQFPSAPPAQSYEPHAPNQQYYPPPQGHEQV